MHRSFALFAAMFIVTAALSVAAVPHLGAVSKVVAQFETNTPPPDVINFATSTPRMTPTPSLTPSNTPTATLTPSSTPTPTPTPNGPFSYPEGVNPLTGKPYGSPEAMSRRNLIVKISNYPPIVRPQTNVNLADVVYEVEAEGGVTRFAAIFREHMPDKVGSVRSARLLDLELIVMYDALLAYSGTSEPIQKLILGSEYVWQFFSPLKGDNENAGFQRFPKDGLAFEHTMFLNTQTLYALATERQVNVPRRAKGFAFSETPDPNGQPANDIQVRWYGQIDARWQYDPKTGRYLRWTDGVPHTDAATGEQLWADNLVIIEVAHNRRPDLFPEGANYESLEIALFPRERLPEDQQYMRAVLVRDGKAYYGYWLRRDDKPGSALQLIYGNNTPMMMKPGRTWVSVVRSVNNASISETYADMAATATAVMLTPSPTPINIDTGD